MGVIGRFSKRLRLELSFFIMRLISLCRQNDNKKYSFIIFSKDRPMQLHALLKSIKYYVSGEFNIYILYSANTSSSFEKAYKEVENYFINDNTFFVKEELGFRKQLQLILSKIDCSRIFFLVDFY